MLSKSLKNLEKLTLLGGAITIFNISLGYLEQLIVGDTYVSSTPRPLGGWDPSTSEAKSVLLSLLDIDVAAPNVTLCCLSAH